MREIIYYLRDDNKKPVTSVTILQDSDGKVSRGVTMCCPLDQFEKDTGRTLAQLRATKALRKERSFGKIRRDGLLIDHLFKFKCEFDPDLTLYEKELMKEPQSK